MNKQLLPSLAGLFMIATSGLAQIPNGGFETWSTGPGYDDSDQWVTWNSTTWTLGGVLSCEQGTPGAVGASFVKVTTRNVTGIGILPGFIYSGDQISGLPGFPYAQRPGALNGQWQYNVLAGDQAIVTVALTKWNTGTQTQDAIGYGAVQATGALSSWQDFSAAITYFSVDDPDTALIYIYSSAGSGVAGSTIWADDLSFGAAAGIAEQDTDPGFELSPSPTTDVLHIDAGDQISEVNVIDARGRQVSNTTLNDISATVDVTQLPAGIYIVRVRFAEGRIAVRPFVKN